MDLHLRHTRPAVHAAEYGDRASYGSGKRFRRRHCCRHNGRPERASYSYRWERAAWSILPLV